MEAKKFMGGSRKDSSRGGENGEKEVECRELEKEERRGEDADGRMKKVKGKETEER